MKRIIIGSFLLAYLLLADNAFTNNLTAKDVGGMLLGAGASLGVHELGHYAVGNATGKAELYDTRWKYYGKHNEAVGMAGFAFQGIGSEVLMATVKRDNRFLIGYVGFNILNNISYVAITEHKGGVGRKNEIHTNDFMNFENKTQKRVAEAAVLAHSAWLAYRLLTDRDFKTWIGIEVQDKTPLITLSCRF